MADIRKRALVDWASGEVIAVGDFDLENKTPLPDGLRLVNHADAKVGWRIIRGEMFPPEPAIPEQLENWAVICVASNDLKIAAEAWFIAFDPANENYWRANYSPLWPLGMIREALKKMGHGGEETERRLIRGAARLMGVPNA